MICFAVVLVLTRNFVFVGLVVLVGLGGGFFGVAVSSVVGFHDCDFDAVVA